MIKALVLVLLLAGCANKPIIVVPPDKPVNLAAQIYEPCSKLRGNVEIKTFEDLVYQYAELGTQYGICANKQLTSIELLKQFSK